MNTKQYKYIHFDEVDAGDRKTKVWECINNSWDDVLGEIKWYAPWRQYCYFPMDETIFNVRCLKDIADFIQKAMDDRQIDKALKEGR